MRMSDPSMAAADFEFGAADESLTRPFMLSDFNSILPDDLLLQCDPYGVSFSTNGDGDGYVCGSQQCVHASAEAEYKQDAEGVERKEAERLHRNKSIRPRRQYLRGPKFAIKMKSDADVVEDGYRWRKYGQKVVKNNRFPRNYYRCTYKGCKVKKHVERQFTDPEYVYTTYEGVHTHPTAAPRVTHGSSFQHHVVQSNDYPIPNVMNAMHFACPTSQNLFIPSQNTYPSTTNVHSLTLARPQGATINNIIANLEEDVEGRPSIYDTTSSSSNMCM